MIIFNSVSLYLKLTCRQYPAIHTNYMTYDMPIIIFNIKHTHPSGRTVMLRSVSDLLIGEPLRLSVGDGGGVCQACVFFLRNPYVVQTWAGTIRVDVTVQLLVSHIIVLHYRWRP